MLVSNTRRSGLKYQRYHWEPFLFGGAGPIFKQLHLREFKDASRWMMVCIDMGVNLNRYPRPNIVSRAGWQRDRLVKRYWAQAKNYSCVD